MKDFETELNELMRHMPAGQAPMISAYLQTAFARVIDCELNSGNFISNDGVVEGLGHGIAGILAAIYFNECESYGHAAAEQILASCMMRIAKYAMNTAETAYSKNVITSTTTHRNLVSG